MASKKELREQYKQMKFPMGVFQIRNIQNGKIFIESALNLNSIWNRHRTQLELGMHPNQQLQQEWKEFGEQAFAYEILSELEQDDQQFSDPRKELKKLEQLFIEEKQPFGEKGYHITKK